MDTIKATSAETRQFGDLSVSAEVYDGVDFFARRLVARKNDSMVAKSEWIRTYESFCELAVNGRRFVSFSEYWSSGVIETEVPIELVGGNK